MAVAAVVVRVIVVVVVVAVVVVVVVVVAVLVAGRCRLVVVVTDGRELYPQNPVISGTLARRSRKSRRPTFGD